MNSLLVKFDNYLNPILVKELRQNVRGTFFVSGLIIFIAAMTFSLFFAIGNADVGLDWGQGEEVIKILIGSLFFGSFFVIPVYFGRKVSTEMKDKSNELMYITTMSTESIVRGKVLCCILLILMLYCAFTPYVALAMFLGGIDMNNLIATILACFLASTVAVFGQLCIGLSKPDGFGNIVTKVVALIIHFILYTSIQAMAFEMLGGMMVSSRLTNVFLAAGTMSIAVVIGLDYIGYYFAVGMLSPVASNKSYKVRLIATIFWCIGGLASLVYDEFSEFWFIGGLILAIIASVLAQVESEFYTKRIIKEIPDKFLPGLLKFPLCSGVANGFVWSFLIFLSTLVIGVYAEIPKKLWSSYCGVDEVLANTWLWYAEVNAYLFIGNRIKHWFMEKRSNTIIPAISIMAFLIIGIVIPLSVNDYKDWIFFGNPIYLVDSYRMSKESIVSLSTTFMVFAFLLWAKAFAKQIGDYFLRKGV